MSEDTHQETQSHLNSLPVRLENVRKSYQTADGPLPALDTTSVTIKAGEFFTVVGPSGCGKSTLLMLISGLIPTTEGTIFIGDEEVTKPYTNLGFIFQKDVLMDWRTVRSNVILPVEIKKLKPRDVFLQRADEILQMVGLEGFEERYPSELSGGMRQRVSISRSLITEPPLLLMDEPFGALDALTRDQMNDDLLRVWSKNQITVIFITHSIAEAVYLSDRIMVMSTRPGRILEIIELDDLPRPRTAVVKNLPAFQEHISHIRQIFVSQGILTATGEAEG